VFLKSVLDKDENKKTVELKMEDGTLISLPLILIISFILFETRDK